jgi:hypothetical protein
MDEQPMGYTVFSALDDDGARGSGLTLSEAFARMMAFAHCDYAFGRFNGDMHLTVTPADDASGGFEAEPRPECRSKLLNNEMARAEIMRRFLKRGVNGYRIVTDEEWQREERRRAEEQGIRPTRHIEID